VEDKNFAENETRKMEQDEANREQHFIKVKGFQVRNEEKYKKLSNY
jgi:hypothetical protein